MPAHLYDRRDGRINTKPSCCRRWRCDNILYERIHDRSSYEDKCKTVKSLFDTEPFMAEYTGCNETSSDEKKREDHESIFDISFYFWRLLTHKWYINYRAILGKPENPDNEESCDDVERTYGAIFWPSCEELGDLDKSRIHTIKNNCDKNWCPGPESNRHTLR